MYYKKIYSIALIITSVLVLNVWKLIDTVQFSHFPVIKDMAQVTKDIIVIMINIVFAYGLFSAFVHMIVFTLEKIVTIKKIIFASSYFEGTWVGFFIAYDGKPVVFYQIIEQDIKRTSIFSEMYHVDKTRRGYWRSSSDVTIDSSKLSLCYLYDSTLTIGEIQVTGGMFMFNYLKGGNYFITPCRMHGYAFNTIQKTKLETLQIKISDCISIENEGSINKLLDDAIKFYENENKNPTKI